MNKYYNFIINFIFYQGTLCGFLVEYLGFMNASTIMGY